MPSIWTCTAGFSIMQMKPSKDKSMYVSFSGDACIYRQKAVESSIMPST